MRTSTAHTTFPLIALLPAVAALMFTGCGTRETATATIEAPFHALDLAAASAQAQAEGKLVFVDLWAPWCGPCKLLDTTTWKDPAVTELLTARTIAIKVNVDDHADIANKYKVDSIPTLLALRPDGTVVARVTGYVDAAGFQTEFRETLGGKL